MNPIAIIFDKYEISWALILIVMSVLVWFFFVGALYPSGKKGRGVLWLYLPLSVAFSFFFARLIYWYSHQSSFDGFGSALKSGDLSAFALLGILFGLVLSAGLLRLVRLVRDLPMFLDLIAPPTLLALGLFSLTCLFGDSCRGKTIITAPAFCRLPFSIATLNQQGETEYRFATFFVAFLLLTVLSFVGLIFYLRHKQQKGSTACFCLILFSGSEFVLESTRYDAGYFPANGFVSILQIAAAVFIVGVTVYFSFFAKKNTVSIKKMIPFWVLLLLSMGATGYLEYLVQRHGDKAVPIHFGMCLSVLGMVAFPCVLFYMAYRNLTKTSEKKEEE